MLPRSRSTRHAFKSKESLEKERLRHRTGGYFRYEDVRNPIDVVQSCPSHIGNIERMTAGPACEDVNFSEREQRKAVRDELTEARRSRNYHREESRWRAISEQEKMSDERVRRMQADPMMGRKNVHGKPFNIVSHDYDKTPAGATLQHHDNMIRYRSKVREAHIAVRNHLGFNPIIGQQTHEVSLPPPPRPPPLMQLA